MSETTGHGTAASPSSVLLEGIDLKKSFGRGRARTEVLHGVSVRLRAGECLAVIGGSGSGKSTLTRILLSLETPDSGDVRYRGASIEGRAGRDALTLLRRESGVVYQDPYASLDPRWTVRRSVGEPLALRGVAPDERDARVREALESVSLEPALFLDRYPMDLSGGQAQRVAIARAIITDPAVLLADEAMSAIDVAARLQILDALKAIRARGVAMLMVSHDLGVVQHLADRILVIHDGHVVEEGSTAAILEAPQAEYTRELVAAATL
ncbi:MAG: dipeptide/oligopeptide/nickel ABC transporter ATP-binding protein [Bifidobacterium sp.]|nr:dipeptide/oligopeptide/nickel ABC transporter ATP-binding protein [Bifidobacterium sp.]